MTPCNVRDLQSESESASARGDEKTTIVSYQHTKVMRLAVNLNESLRSGGGGGGTSVTRLHQHVRLLDSI